MKEENKDISDDNLNSSNTEDDNLDDNKTETADEEANSSTSLTEENAKLNDLLLRSRAEIENIQKRTIKQIQQAQLYSTEKLSSELLVVMDSLEAAEKLSTKPNLKVEDLIEGNSLLLKTTKEVFEKLNIEEIDPIDKEFDPEYHQALSTKEADNTENTVIEVVQKGYKLKSKLLRPALVIVSKKVK